VNGVVIVYEVKGGGKVATIREQINRQYSWRAQSLASVSLVEQAMLGLELLDADFYADFGENEYYNNKSIAGPYIVLEPKHLLGIAFTFGGLAIVDTTPTIGDAAQVLLPKVGKWTKSFDEANNLIRLTGEFKGVRIVLQDKPPDTCKVHKIEEDVEVPEKVVPAHTEKKIHYVMEGDCDPLMTTRSTQSEPVRVNTEELS
jgi:hypothetical protein